MSDQQPGPGAGPDPQDVREEAERLVATGMAALSMVAERIGAPSRERGGSVAAGYDALGDVLFGPAGHRRHSVANESPECCRCPVCRAISAVREPNPQVTERLATGAGTVAEGAARVLRGLAGAAGAVRETWQPHPQQKSSQQKSQPAPQQKPQQRPGPESTDPWAAATAEPAAPAKKTVAKKSVAKKAVAKKAVKKAPPAAQAEPSPAAAKVAKKATAKQTVAKKSAAKKAVAKKSAATKGTGKKSAAEQDGAAPPPGLAGEADR